jgi:NADH-quinone oxidoreductase subunit K
LFVVVVAAAEVGVGLAIVLTVFRLRETVSVDTLTQLADRDPRPQREHDAADVAQ